MIIIAKKKKKPFQEYKGTKMTSMFKKRKSTIVIWIANGILLITLLTIIYMIFR